ncbi:nuclear pore complex protein Nup153 isoform X2 [Carcharodon carcharias]|uniref:nuclear pore complex protein Nup153 isoform X2 n=1 Tax=Carcharodon carcharias TaxID=13397 RepID=UPI001B7E8F3C|nr:nuclear pore complex protein Nup153 isoform X2 [Carcharodon carcharias]
MAAATGGGGGGGKIRNKRHHIISKPYTKNQGIIGRVTNTVKNIVPGWLQKYFGKVSKTEPAEARGSVNNHENVPVLVNETPPFDNGRHQPSPTTGSATVGTPSSKSALNFSEMLLLRPALSRAHFNCAALDTPAHDCQPSTSSSFPIGNSGFSLVKEIKDSGSLHEDDNISTTSGFSSRASDKDVITSRNASLPPLWSPEGERFHSVPQQSATSLKRPSFNLSAFGSSPPSFISTSLLNSSQLGDSPFYPGKTAYGGAAAAGRTSQTLGTPYQVPIRRQMKAKPASSPSYGVTSATARRILQSLEKMSSPLADAKRIPSTVISPLPILETQGPPVQKLQTPVIVSGPANRSIFFKPSLTPGGQGNRHIDRTEIQNNRTREKSPAPEISLQATKSDSSCSYQVIGSHATNGLTFGGAGGKMKRDKGHYSSRGAQEVQASAPELPEVSLPIKSTALPTFNFGPPSTAVSPVTTTVTKYFTDKAVVSSPNSVAFTFSTPNIKATKANLQPVSVSTGFTFSEPIDKSVPFVFVSARPSINAAKCTTSPSISTPTNESKGEECDGPLKPAKTLKQGSVLDILKGPEFTSPSLSTQCITKSLDNAPATVKPLPSTTGKSSSSIESSSTFGFGDKFKPAEGSWQCGSCFLQNKSTDSKCVACQTAKSALPVQTNNESANRDKATSKETSLSFGDKFKPAMGTWGCDICLVQNKSEAVKCVACETPKPGTGVKSALTLPVVTESTRIREPNTSSSTSVGLGLADQFKKPEGVWDCAVCLLQNKAEDSKCVACQSTKPGVSSVVANISATTPTEGILGFGDKFKKPTGSWDCEVCFVQNSSSVNKCVACKTEKTGIKIESKGLGSSLLSTAASPFISGIQPSTVDSLQSKDGAAGFKFGNQGGFKFGASDSSASTSAFGGLKFEVTGGFKFGVTSTEKNSEGNKKDNSKISSGGFKFEVAAFGNKPASTTTKFGASDTGQQNKKSDVAFGGFKLDAGGTIKAEDKSALSGFKLGTEGKKETSVVQFQLDKAEERKDGTTVNAVKFEKTIDQETVAASAFMFGKSDEKQDTLSSAPIVFGKRKDIEQLQPELTFKKPEQTKESASLSDVSKPEAKSGFTFNLVKPAEKPEATETVQQGFVFGAAVNTSEQGVTKPTFNLFSNSSSTPAAANAGGSTPSIFGNSALATNPPFLFGQASATMGSANLGSSSESIVAATKPFLFGSQDVKSTVSTSSAGASVVPFSFGSAPSNNTATSSVFTFGASTTTSSSTGSSSNPIFAFGSSSTVAANPSPFGSTQTPVPLFGQSSSQPPAAFGSSGAPTFAFSTGCQQPAFGSQSTNSQPSLFGGQLPNQQPTFGSTSSTSSNSFQFGNSSVGFNFNATNSSNEVFKFGSPSTGASQQPGPTGGFQFNPAPGFTVGVGSTNPFSTTSSGRSTVTGRKIKTAVRRKK